MAKNGFAVYQFMHLILYSIRWNSDVSNCISGGSIVAGNSNGDCASNMKLPSGRCNSNGESIISSSSDVELKSAGGQ